MLQTRMLAVAKTKRPSLELLGTVARFFVFQQLQRCVLFRHACLAKCSNPSQDLVPCKVALDADHVRPLG